MSDETALRARARVAINKETIPTRPPDRVWGGPGIGGECVICNLPVSAREMELEMQFACEDGVPQLVAYRVHLACFAAWELERSQAPH